MAAKWHLAQGKTWREKLEREHPNHGKVVAISPKMQKRFGPGTMVIPRPLHVDALVRRVKKGKLMTQSQLRTKLAAASKADHACPLTTGMFLRIAAEAAEEDRRNGKKRITPYWRIIKDDGSLNDRFPGGARAQARNLRSEGFTIVSGKAKNRLKISQFEKHLMV